MLRQLRQGDGDGAGGRLGKGLSATVQKVTDIKEIVGYGVMRTPGLVVNGKVVASGRVPARDEILTWLSA